MSEPLDKELALPVKKPIYAVASMAASIAAVVFAKIGSYMLPSEMHVGEMFLMPGWLPNALKVSVLFSVVFVLLSFTSKEKTILKWIAVGLIVFQFFSIAGLILLKWFARGGL